jgi:hypothetical protein
MTLISIDPKLPIPDTIIRLTPIQERFNSAIITATEHIDAPPICIEIKEGDLLSEIGTLGNISLFIGKAKQGKTFAISMVIAAAETGEWLMDKIRVNLPADKKTVLYIDTEQSRHHEQRVLKRILKLANRDEAVNIIALNLRKYSPAERLEIVEHAINNVENLGLVILDGIRDLITSINDEEQSSMITSRLLKWSEEINCHICVVLHTNKNDTNARGHLGTELTNKSESVISIQKDTENKENIIVKPEYCRNREFSEWLFTIDEYGMPVIVDCDVKIPVKKQLSPVDVDKNTHILVLNAVFKLKNEYKYSELQDQVKDYFMRYGVTFGLNKSREFITFYLNDLWIKKEGLIYRRLNR